MVGIDAERGRLQAREVQPLTLDWGAYSVRTAPLTARGITVLQALSALRVVADDYGKFAEPQGLHLRLEILRLAWQHRLKLLGDPDQEKIPVGAFAL